MGSCWQSIAANAAAVGFIHNLDINLGHIAYHLKPRYITSGVLVGLMPLSLLRSYFVIYQMGSFFLSPVGKYL